MFATVASSSSAAFERGVHHAAEREDCDPLGQQRDAFAAAANLAFADRQRLHLLLDRRRPDRRRADSALPPAYSLKRGVQHLPAFVLVRRRHHGHVGQAAQIGDVEAAVVRRAVSADEAAAIDGQQHRQVLYRHVMYQLVVRALQERRINRDDRLAAFAREPAAKVSACCSAMPTRNSAPGYFSKNAPSPSLRASRA